MKALIDRLIVLEFHIGCHLQQASLKSQMLSGQTQAFVVSLDFYCMFHIHTKQPCLNTFINPATYSLMSGPNRKVIIRLRIANFRCRNSSVSNPSPFMATKICSKYCIKFQRQNESETEKHYLQQQHNRQSAILIGTRNLLHIRIRKTTNWWDTVKRHVTHPRETGVNITCHSSHPRTFSLRPLAHLFTHPT